MSTNNEYDNGRVEIVPESCVASSEAKSTFWNTFFQCLYLRRYLDLSEQMTVSFWKKNKVLLQHIVGVSHSATTRSKRRFLVLVCGQSTLVVRENRGSKKLYSTGTL